MGPHVSCDEANGIPHGAIGQHNTARKRISTDLSCSVHYLPQYLLSSAPRRSENQEAQQIIRVQVSFVCGVIESGATEIQHLNSKSSLSSSRSKRSQAVGSLIARRQKCVIGREARSHFTGESVSRLSWITVRGHYSRLHPWQGRADRLLHSRLDAVNL